MRLLTVLLLVCFTLPASAQNWPQFRGPNGAALPADDKKLPTEIGPDQNVLWKVPLAPGHSSPVIFGDRIFLTAVENKKLYTLALDRTNGKELWRREAPYKKLEKVHSIGSHAQSSVVTDGTHVVSLFGSSGLFCHDVDGKELWRLPMGPYKTEFGSATSPLLIDGKLIINQDYDSDSYIAAHDVYTGKVLWKTDRSEFATGYATPILWNVEGKKQIVQAGTLRIVGYDFQDGKELWTVRGLSRIMNMSPTIGPDNILYVGGWGAGADPGDKIVIPPFDEFMSKQDANKNGTLEADEVPPGPVKERFAQFDRDRDDHVTRKEWEGMRNAFAMAKNRLIAVKPGGKGEITDTHVLWEQTKQLPYIPSPLFYKGVLFLVKNGGLVSSLDPKTGQSLKFDRISGQGQYYSSPVGGDGKIYTVSQKGDLAVLSAEAQWEVLHEVRFMEDVYATPAIAGGRIYFRTSENLYCFGIK